MSTLSSPTATFGNLEVMVEGSDNLDIEVDRGMPYLGLRLEHTLFVMSDKGFDHLFLICRHASKKFFADRDVF